MKISAIASLLFFSAIIHVQAQIPAFPGAQGFGATSTTGGRGGQVIYVTNLDCEGPGSLNAALATPGPKYILFKVSGIIDCAAEIQWGDCYIAGQTSPGGIIVRGILADDFYDPGGKAQNIIIRHLNSRPNDETVRPGAGWVLDDGMRLDGAANVVVDHCSFANAVDEQVQISRSKNIIVQNCMLAEPLGDHFPFGGMLLNYSTVAHPKDSISIHHNVWNRVGGRFPEISCEQSGEEPADQDCLAHPLRIEISNNVFWDQQIELYYNSGFYTSDQEAQGLQLRANFVNNRSVVRSGYCNGMFRDLMLAFSVNELFASGNTMSRYQNYHDYELFYCCNDFCDAGNNPNTNNGAALGRNQRFPFPAINYTPTEDLLAWVSARAGAFNALSANRRDPMNRRLLQALQSQTIDPKPINGTDYYHDAYQLDFTAQPAAPLDSDGDGMPDNWENLHGLNPQAQDHNGTQLSVPLTGVSGYTNLECYLNQLAGGLVGGTTPVQEPLAAEWVNVHFDILHKTLYVNLLNGGAEHSPLQVNLLDAGGKTIRSTVYSGESQVRTDFQSLPAGLYFVQILAGGKMESVRVCNP